MYINNIVITDIDIDEFGIDRRSYLGGFKCCLKFYRKSGNKRLGEDDKRVLAWKEALWMRRLTKNAFLHCFSREDKTKWIRQFDSAFEGLDED